MFRGSGRQQRPRGRSSPSSAAGRHNNNNHQSHVAAAAHPNNASVVHGSGPSNSEASSVDGVTKQFNTSALKSNHHYRPNLTPHAVGNSRLIWNSGGTPKQQNTPSNMVPAYTQMEPPMTTYSCLEDGQFPQTSGGGKSASAGGRSDGEFEKLDGQQKEHSFDICQKISGNVVKLKSSLFVKNREKRNEKKRLVEGGNIKILRSGMVLLKGYLSLMDQVKLVNSCRDLGRATGGFYQPGYRDGAMLHLKMMCLGKNWDPETSLYGDERPVDGAIPPPIPADFKRLVKEAIEECHDYLQSHSKVNAKDILPPMSPNICIVNFYTKTGKLGLHQDKDESPESLRKGLPVVSFSLGDSADFLYGDQRDMDKAEKVVLESGDVLVFGGKSRHVFHGVSSIIPDTTSKALSDETNLRPGRLNLTFREY